MKLGKPEDFYNNIQIRLKSIEKAIAQYQFSAAELKKSIQNKITPDTKLFLKGYGNEVNLLSCFRELFFNSRELLNNLLIRLNRDTKGKSYETSRNFLTFSKKLMAGSYDASNLSIIAFLKTNITHIFHIRKVRNEIKTFPANIEFRYNTNRFETFFKVPIKSDEKNLIQYLDIRNKDEALKNNSYSCTYILDKIFPEMLEFWKTCFSIYEKDKESLTTHST